MFSATLDVAKELNKVTTPLRTATCTGHSLDEVSASNRLQGSKTQNTSLGGEAMSSPSELTGLNEWAGQTTAGVRWQVMRGDTKHVLETLEENRFDCVITSPPYYWQRDYRVEHQIGLEPTILDYVTAIADSMDQVRRVLRSKGLLFLNMSDTYYSAKGKPKGTDRKNPARRFGLRAVDASGLGVPRKTLIGIPWRVSLAMIERGWVLRSPIIWQKEKFMPEPTAKDRPWRTYETIFMFSKSQRYNFFRPELNDEEDIWTIPTNQTTMRCPISLLFQKHW